MSITKNVLLNSYSSMKKNQKDSDDFWHRKLTLKVKFWHFLTARHYSNSPNFVISSDYSWFLAKNLYNFVSLPWKLHNRYCHSNYTFILTWSQHYAYSTRINVLQISQIILRFWFIFSQNQPNILQTGWVFFLGSDK